MFANFFDQSKVSIQNFFTIKRPWLFLSFIRHGRRLLVIVIWFSNSVIVTIWSRLTLEYIFRSIYYNGIVNDIAAQSCGVNAPLWEWSPIAIVPVAAINLRDGSAYNSFDCQSSVLCVSLCMVVSIFHWCFLHLSENRILRLPDVRLKSRQIFVTFI